jgi:pimeloyl-ACP methyl ester carboxylesterase
MSERSELRLADGVRLSVETSGPASAPVTVIFLHGWCLDRRTWRGQIAALKGTGTRVVAYDARGHGRSSGTTLRSATLPRLGDDLAAVIDAYAPRGRVVLAGHSLGGMTVMEYAASHPGHFQERVAGLLLVSTTAEGVTHTKYGLPAPLAPLLRLVEQTGAGVLARLGPWNPHRVALPVLQPAVRWLLFGDEYDGADLQLCLRALGRASLRSIGGFRPSVGAQRQLETLAALGGIPAAVLVGDRDKLTPPPCARSIADALPGTRLTVCAGAGHMLMMERPAVVTAALTRVLAQAGPRLRYGRAA